MDKTLAKKTNKILFVKIENDGFNLGAQRRPIDKNDLPKALEYLIEYHKAQMNDTDVEDMDFAHSVEKDKIAKSGDWNLSGGRFRDYHILKISNYDLVPIEDVCFVRKGTAITKKMVEEGKIPVIAGAATGLLSQCGK